MVKDAAWWGLRQYFHRGIYYARVEHPVVEGPKGANGHGAIDAESNLDPIFQHYGCTRCRHRNQTAACVYVHNDIAHRVAHNPALIPADDTRVPLRFGRVKLSPWKRSFELDGQVNVIHRGNLSHLSRQSLEIPEVIGHFDPIVGLEAQY